MAKKRLSRKEIKQPDEFLTLWTRIFNYFDEHRKLLLFSIVGIVLISSMVWGGVAYWEKREGDASQMLAKAQSVLLAVDEASSEKGNEAKKKDQEKAEEILSDLITQYKRCAASQVASSLLGNLNYQRRDYEKSIANYQSLLKSGPRDPLLEALAYEGLGYGYEGIRDYKEALIYYQKLADSKIEYVRGSGLLGSARCYELQNDAERALETYRKFLSTYPRDPRAEEARASIARLSLQSSGPKAPGTEIPHGGPGSGTPDTSKKGGL
jgi:tetratricopeptide (TPR) repeat protein